MGLTEFRKNIIDFRTALLNAKSKGISLNFSRAVNKVYDFNKSKEDYYKKAVQVTFEQVKSSAPSLAEIAVGDAENQVLVSKINSLVAELDIPDSWDKVSSKIIELVSKLNVPETNRLKKPDFIPSEIRADIFADIDELDSAFNARCYRSSAILCGRILEVALHRKYFDATGDDLLEKAPGIGLGKIIAKLSEQNINFDPGLMQQIHLINNVRISSVHVKQEPFNPSRAQAQAMILYTFDILEKVFKTKA